MKTPQKPHVAIIGAGPAGLMAADVVSQSDAVAVTVYDAMPSAGRKFLMAGRGGLNLTHSEAFDAFVQRYGARADCMAAALRSYSPTDVRAWCEAHGQPTFVGTSGRVFPKAMKASGLLRAWLRQLAERGVTLNVRHRWTGFDRDGALMFETPDAVVGDVRVTADATVLALGGASWPRLGSDGRWVDPLKADGVDVAELHPSNCGFLVSWSDVFRQRFEGQPLKGIGVAHGEQQARGDAVISAFGVEGGAIYAVSALLREALLSQGQTALMVDLKPDVDVTALTTQLRKPRGKQTFSNFLRKAARLAPVAIGLAQEIALADGLRLADLSPEALAGRIKSVRLPITGIGSFDRAISTAGGVCFEALDDRLMLRQRRGLFMAGEMLDWDAPTGGYLLQGCFATGAAAGRGVVAYLGEK